MMRCAWRGTASRAMPSLEMLGRRIIRVSALTVAALTWGCGEDETSAPAANTDYATPATPSYVRGPTQAQVPPLPFTEIAHPAGIDFIHANGSFGDKWMPETMGSGVAFDDLDGDGDADVVLVNDTWWPGHEGSGAVPTSAAFANDGFGHFSNATDGSGLDVPIHGMGITAADYDADGDKDLFLTTLGANLLLQQQSPWHYENVAVIAGVEGSLWQDEEGRSHPEWSTAATWIDVDDDGLVDLFVGNYVQWSPENDLYFSFDGESKSYATPPQYQGSTPRLYRNLGDGTFEEVTEAAGVFLPEAKSMGVAVADFDDDGDADLVVTNDTQPNFLLQNDGGRFKEVGLAAGIGYDESGRARAGMGVDVALLADDAAQTIGIGNFSREALSLYRQTQPQSQLFLDVAGRSQLVESTLSTLTFGLRFADFDLDGRQDLILANGHIEPEINSVQKEISYAQRPQLFWNDGDGHLLEASAAGGAVFAGAIVGRGLAVADLEGDGDADVLLSTNAGPALLLRNETLPASDSMGPHALSVQLQGESPSLHGLGAIVEVRTKAGRQRQRVRTGSSYMSHSQTRLLFGLGTSSKVDRITVRWPDQRVTLLNNLDADFHYLVDHRGVVARQPLTTR